MSSAQNKGVELEEDLPSSKDGASQTGSGASALATSGANRVIASDARLHSLYSSLTYQSIPRFFSAFALN